MGIEETLNNLPQEEKEKIKEKLQTESNTII